MKVPFALSYAVVLALPLTLPASAGAADEDTALNVIEFKTHVQGNKGVVRCGLFRRDGWLKDPVQFSIAPIHGGIALCVFKRIPKGVYGLSGFHDENNNGKLDTNFLGMPLEDYCASRGARGTLGPPSFKDAQFKFTGGTKRLDAWMK